MKKSILLFLLITILFNCSSNKEEDCAAVSCLSLAVKVHLVDRNNNSNYIVDNQLEIDDFTVSSAENPFLNFSISNNNNMQPYIFIGYAESLTLTIQNKTPISISMIKSAPKTNHCCDSGNIESVESSSHESSYDVDLNTFTIYL